MTGIAVLAAGTILPGEAAGDGDIRRGETLFRHECAVCHSTVPGYHKEGPSLAAVVGRRAGTAPAFARYKGLKGADVVWTAETLDAWLADPRAFLGGRNTTMTLAVPDPEERADIIAYLAALE